MSITLAEALTWKTKQSHELLNATFADVDQDLANREAPGHANPLGSAFAHVVISEDTVIHGLFGGKAPLCASSWAGKTGVDLPMPIPGMVEGDLGDWYRDAKVDVEQLRIYAAEVFSGTERWIASADEATLSRTMDVPFLHMGEKSVAELFMLLVLTHCDNYSGEISAIKGVFGLKGYPM